MKPREVPWILPATLAVIVLACGARQSHEGKGEAGDDVAVQTVQGAAAPDTDGHHRRPNRLAQEHSPYLLQHAYNPVDWYPWGEEALARAHREDRPIFLSIGYSTCHWCHVMERESFENDSVAALLNRYFVCIKVDREERPDVDRVYMTAAQAMGLGGGWPLNVFLTPDLEPFFGGTYFPPSAKHGRPGLLELLPRIHKDWLERRAQLARGGRRVLEILAETAPPDSHAFDRARVLEDAYRTIQRSYDSQDGGFGPPPRFPSIDRLSFLLRAWAIDRVAHARAKDMVLRQLDAMRAGGIHDQLGGGFHRYSTDAQWRVPHFEKMLYDQAQLAWAYLEGYQITGNPAYAATARGIFDYVGRDLGLAEGAFAAAEDADSEGEEGRFYVWHPAQLEQVLGARDAERFAFRYGVTPSGNFASSASVLYEAHSIEEAAEHFRTTSAEAAAQLERDRALLLEARSRRIRPHRDDKVIVAWNGLMISALARGARVLEDPALARRAEAAAEFVWSHLYDPATGSLRRSWRAGMAGADGQLDDYAHFGLGLIDLYQATFDPKWLSRAVAINEALMRRFWDEKDGAFFESPADDRHVPVRLKAYHDGPELAGGSIAALDLLMLGTLLDREDWLERARRTFDYHAARSGDHPEAMSQMLAAMVLQRSTPRHIVIAGRRAAPETRRLLAEVHRRFLPNDLLLLVDGTAATEALTRLVPFTRTIPVVPGKATAYVCVNYACRLPTSDPKAFAAQLEEPVLLTNSRR